MPSANLTMGLFDRETLQGVLCLDFQIARGIRDDFFQEYSRTLVVTDSLKLLRQCQFGFKRVLVWMGGVGRWFLVQIKRQGTKVKYEHAGIRSCWRKRCNRRSLKSVSYTHLR